MTDELQRKADQINVLRSQAAELQEKMQLMQQALGELSASQKALASYKDLQNGSLFPLGSGVFAKARLEAVEKVLVDVGGRVLVEQSLQDAQKTLEKRKGAIEKSAQDVTNNYAAVIGQLEKISQEAEEIIQRRTPSR
ncbi:prefoldin subunit alpha [Candidatus Micrarchaeota archaeon]|nr:prefoldin subunit alpha [Candidatus Micrarchaeota archaeon]